MTRALLQQALEALEHITGDSSGKTGAEMRHDIRTAAESLRAELAKPETVPPDWHDAPTGAGLWLCNEGQDNPYRFTTHRVRFPMSPLLVGKDERWYGPIPADTKEQRA